MQIAICHYSFNKRWKKENWTADRLAQEVKALGVEGIDFHTGLIGPPDQARDLMNSAVPEFHVMVMNDQIYGIAPHLMDRGVDQIEVAERHGGALQLRQIQQISEQDEEWLTLIVI